MAWSNSKFCDFAQFNKNEPRNLTRTFKSSRHPENKMSVAQLEQLNIGSTANVIGTVIAKEDTKSIFSKKAQGTERFLLSFTVRDSPSFFANCTFWGSENFIKDLARVFIIGDVVQIENAQVQQNPTDGSDEKFRVSTPLPFHLTLSENHSSLTIYNGIDIDMYSSLQHIPTKSSSDYYTLEDVLANDQNLNGEHINILAAVRNVPCPVISAISTAFFVRVVKTWNCVVGPVKEITTRTGKHTKRCEVKLFDESCQSFPLVLWGEELVNFVQTWSSYETVVFVADVRMNYEHYRNIMVATAASKTILTVNPDTVDAKCLFQLAQTQTFSSEAETEFYDPPLDEIQDIKTVDQVLNNQGSTAYAILYGVITKFDLDADNSDQFFVRKCVRCKKMVTQEKDFRCLNPECSLGALQMFNTGGQVTLEGPELEFRMPITISDHTGTVSGRLTANILETMTGMKAKEIFALDVQKRTDIKWHYLLERCKLHIKVQKNFRDQEKSTIRIMSCSRANIEEMESGFV